MNTRKIMDRRKLKTLMKMDTIIEWITNLRDRARELDELRNYRKSKNGLFSVIDEEGNEHVSVDLTKSEYRAIRWFLMRKRRQMLKDEGVL